MKKIYWGDLAGEWKEACRVNRFRCAVYKHSGTLSENACAASGEGYDEVMKRWVPFTDLRMEPVFPSRSNDSEK